MLYGSDLGVRLRPLLEEARNLFDSCKESSQFEQEIMGGEKGYLPTISSNIH